MILGLPVDVSCRARDHGSSPLVGPAGNHEYLAWMTLGSQSNKRINSEYIQNLVKETL